MRQVIAVAFAMLAMACTEAQAQRWQPHVIDAKGGVDGIDMADVDGDGKTDFLVPDEGSHDVLLYLASNGDEYIQLDDDIQSTEDAVFTDVDEDGTLDAVAVGEGGEALVYLIDPQDYTTASTITVDNIADSLLTVITADMDGDGHKDVIVGGKNTDVRWYEHPGPSNLASGSWTEHVITGGGWVMWLHVEDVDADADPDLVLTQRTESSSYPLDGLRWVENEGGGSWTDHEIEPDRTAMMADAGDIDGDGDTDYVVAYNDPNQLTLYERTGLTSWEAHEVAVPRPAVATPQAAKLADLDGDGQLDISWSCANVNSGPYLYRVHSTEGPWTGWHFHPVSPDGYGSKYDDAPAVDMDGDGDLDVITTEQNQGLGLLWFENPRL